MTVLVDFHTHTTASDGALDPAALLARARAAGIEQLAITDHDTVAGYRAVAGAAAGITLHPGVELSCQWSGANIHVVGLAMDIDHPALAAGLERLGEARRARAATIAARLGSRGFDGALAGASAIAGASQIGRPHFARWLVQAGFVADEAEAFARFLGRNRPGDVKAFWPDLAEVTGWIVAAGGVAVLAHPLKYRFTRMKLRRLLTDFSAAGGGGLEVVCGRQEPSQSGALRRLAADFGLAASAGSDFHRDSRYGPTLGVDAAVAADRPGVWDRLARGAGDRQAS